MNNRKYKFIILFIIYIAGSLYLTSATPVLPILGSSAISDEEGDTWQNPDQRGYYTNLDRGSVLSQIQQKYSLKVFSFSIPSFRLNYPPEEAFNLVRDQLKSNYLEEVVYPMHSSIFVNGWEPKKSPQYANKPAKEVPDISLYGVPYEAKITLKPVSSSPFMRLAVWTLVFPATYLVFLSLKTALR